MTMIGEALAHLSQGLIEVALAPVMAQFSAREVMFARPHMAVETVVLAPREVRQRRRLSEWAGERLAVMPGFLRALEDLGQPVELLRAVPVSNLAEMERALRERDVSGAIITSLQARALQARLPEAGLVIRTALAVHPMAAAVAFGEHDLLRAVDQVVMLGLDVGEVQSLYRESYGMPFPPLTVFQ